MESDMNTDGGSTACSAPCEKGRPDGPGAEAVLPRREKGLWRLALRWLLVLGPFFFITYNGVNQFTATRADVGSFFFNWEQHIPFWPWTIIPYWSIDFIYAASLFLCRTRRELHLHAFRLLAVSAGCVVCFLFFPLRFSFSRPETQGLFGWLFDRLETFDLPYNQAPSLHIALLVALWSLFRVNTPRRWQWLVHIWALLIGVSVLTTWQHHFVDVYTGVIMGVLVCYALPLPPRRWALWNNAAHPTAARLGRRYGAGALLFAAAAFLLRGWGWLLLWPVLALGTVCAGYFFLGPSIFQKDSRGRLAPAAVCILLPYLLGAWLSFYRYTAKTPPYNWVTPCLVLGQYPTRAFLRELGGGQEAGKDASAVGAVLDLAAGWPRSPLVSKLAYASCPRMDLVPPTEEELEEAVVTLNGLMCHGPVLVHCALGLSRSAIVAVAWLYAFGGAVSLEEALETVRRARPQVALKPGHLDILRTWAEARWARDASLE